MCKYDATNETTVVIVGGGPAGATCAESLRQENFTGKIIMVCLENVLPYDRVKVSKALDFDIDRAALRPQSFYADHKIDVKLGVEATGNKIKIFYYDPIKLMLEIDFRSQYRRKRCRAK